MTSISEIIPGEYGNKELRVSLDESEEKGKRKVFRCVLEIGERLADRWVEALEWRDRLHAYVSKLAVGVADTAKFGIDLIPSITK